MGKLPAKWLDGFVQDRKILASNPSHAERPL